MRSLRRLHPFATLAGFFLSASLPAPALAQGYGVYEQSSCVMGRAGTSVASPCGDGSSIYFNPAGIAAATSTEISAGGTGIFVSGGFTNDVTGFHTSLNNDMHLVPHGYLVRPVSDRLVAGLGVFVPYGLAVDWPSDFEGRFLGYHSKVQAIYVQPTLGVRLAPRLRVGAGFDLTFVSVRLNQRLDLSAQATPTPGVTFGMLGVPAGTDFADVNLTGNGTGVGGHFGVQADLTPELTLGARYLLRQTVNFSNGTAEITPVSTGLTLAAGNPFGAPAGTPLDALLAPQFAPGGLLESQGGGTSITLPAQLVVGLSWRGLDRLNLLADFQYTDWRVFDTLSVTLERLGTTNIPEDYKRAYTWRVGAEYGLSPSSTLRAGFYTHNGAAPDQTVTPNLPEGNRNSWTIGFGTRLGSSLGVDVAYQFIDQGDRRGRTVPLDPALSPAENTNGLYTFKAHLLGVTLRYAF
ncbi:MAG TPA: outer membrane protein transport protein [Gemmatimonadales bacterium]|nr:outer membrane protein transport protein [Gemmatimonadales bacterium]